MEYLLAPASFAAKPDDWRAAALHVAGQPLLSPFDPRALAFIKDVSNAILTSREMRAYPELMAMAHHLRPAVLAKMETDYRESEVLSHKRGAYILPLGLAFHIAPSNVDSVFIYSWFLSMLAGNSNIIRLSRKRGGQLEALCDILRAALARHPAIADRSLALSYEPDDAITAELSGLCQARIVWGGDATVQALRAIPLPALAREVAFPDRFSLALIDAKAVTSMSAHDLTNLAQNFYIDAFWFDQRACSSPRLLLWIGAPDAVRQAQSVFWPAVATELARRGWSLSPAAMIERMTGAQSLTAQGLVTRINGQLAHEACRLEAHQSGPELRERHPGLGTFVEQQVDTLEAALGQLSARDQTVLCIGVNTEALRPLLSSLPARAVDRFVAPGQALVFETIWDGMNLQERLTRIVTIGIN